MNNKYYLSRPRFLIPIHHNPKPGSSWNATQWWWWCSHLTIGSTFATLAKKNRMQKSGTKTNTKLFTTLGQYLNGFILHFSSFFSSPTSSFRRWEIVRFLLSFLQTYLQHGFIDSARKSAWFLTF